MKSDLQLNPVSISVARVRLIEVTGVINETLQSAAAFAPLARERTPIVFDLSGVRRITSIGVRHWIAGLAFLDGLDYFFTNCRPALVLQFNMIAGFAGNGHLLSMFLPYQCTSCSQQPEHFLDLVADYALVVAGQPPECRCTECGAPSELDEDVDFYFSYAREYPAPRLPPPVAALLDDARKTPSLPLKIRKEVGEEVAALWLSGSVQDNVRIKRVAEGLDGDVVVVAQGVRGVTAGGLTTLFHALTAENSNVILARVPAIMAEIIVGEPQLAHWAPRILSIWIALRCKACGHLEENELARSGWRTSNDQALARCGRCGVEAVTPVTSAAITDTLARLSELQGVAPPASVVGYLASRTGLAIEVESERQLRRPSLTMTSVSPSGSASLQLEGYEFLHQLGTGGMAEVMLARQVGPHGFSKLVAVKRILPELASDPVFIDMFLREARIAALITHPNVVQIFDLRQVGPDYYIVMEYVPGWNLDHVLHTATQGMTALPIELACRIVGDICAGLHAAHSAKLENGEPLVVVHRDVSPHNVLVSKVGSVKLTDFGIAKATNAAAVPTSEGLTGKFHYMAPERLDGNDSDTRSDIYSAGLILFECLTECHPFEGENETDTWFNARRAVVPPPSVMRRDVPPELDRLVARAVARDLDARFQTAQDFQLAIERFLTAYRRPATSSHLMRWMEAAFAAAQAKTEGDAPPIDKTLPGSLNRT